MLISESQIQRFELIMNLNVNNIIILKIKISLNFRTLNYRCAESVLWTINTLANRVLPYDQEKRELRALTVIDISIPFAVEASFSLEQLLMWRWKLYT